MFGVCGACTNADACADVCSPARLSRLHIQRLRPVCAWRHFWHQYRLHVSVAVAATVAAVRIALTAHVCASLGEITALDIELSGADGTGRLSGFSLAQFTSLTSLCVVAAAAPAVASRSPLRFRRFSPVVGLVVLPSFALLVSCARWFALVRRGGRVCRRRLACLSNAAKSERHLASAD